LTPYALYSSTELVRACAGSKDESAWAEFIKRFHVVIASAVRRTARRWGEPSDLLLDDLVQDTRLKLCEDGCRLLRTFRPEREESIFGFLKVVAANVVHDHFKAALAAKRGAGKTEPTLEPIRMEAKIRGIESFETINQRLLLEQLYQALIEVTRGKDQQRNRTIFLLRHHQGLTASEIASIPCIKLTTEGVESVLMRLLIMIRSHIDKPYPHRNVKVRRRRNRSKRLGS